jgi:hypothetical protein
MEKQTQTPTYVMQSDGLLKGFLIEDISRVEECKSHTMIFFKKGKPICAKAGFNTVYKMWKRRDLSFHETSELRHKKKGK